MAFRFALVIWAVAAVLAPVALVPELSQAREHFQSRRFEEAAAQLRTILVAAPDNLPARYLLVHTLIEANQPELALREAEAAVEQARSESLSHVSLGDARFRLGDFEGAFATYSEAVRLNALEPRAALGLGRILFSDFRFKSAKEQFQRAFSLDEQDPDIALAVSSVLPWSKARLDLEDQFVAGATYRDPEELEGTRAFISLFRRKAGSRPFAFESQPENLQLELESVPPYSMIPTGFLLPVSINRGEPRKLLVDTAAHGIVISSRFAGLDSIQSFVPYRLGGLGDQGRTPASLGWADTIGIGEIALRDCPIIITDKPVGQMWQGIIGTDVLRSYLVVLDFPDAALRFRKHSEDVAEEYSWDRLEKPGPGFVQLRLVESKLLIPVRINRRSEAYFVLDTGAGRSLIDRKLGERVSNLTPSRRRIQGLSGQVEEALKTEELFVEFGGLERCASLVAVDLSRVSYALGVEIGGLIGCDFLRDVCLTIITGMEQPDCSRGPHTRADLTESIKGFTNVGGYREIRWRGWLRHGRTTKW